MSALFSSPLEPDSPLHSAGGVLTCQPLKEAVGEQHLRSLLCALPESSTAVSAWGSLSHHREADSPVSNPAGLGPVRSQVEKSPLPS